MINISSSSHLDIILPNTNKALARVLQDSTLKELETLSQGKDLKSVMNSILKESAKNPSADKELLQLVKNNPTLKNLGDVSTTIKDLLNSIKDDKNPLPMEKVLKGFLTDIKDLKNSELKQKFENSGVFLESKLKDVKNPQVQLKETLTQLVATLKQSPQTPTKAIIQQTQELLKNPTLNSATDATLSKDLKENPKALTNLASDVQTLLSKMKTVIKGADAVSNPALTKALEKLEHQLDPKILTAENFKLPAIKESLEQVQQIMAKSFTTESKGILGAIEKIFSALKSVDVSTTAPKASLDSFLQKGLPQEITKLTQTIQSVITKADPIFSKDVATLVDKLNTLKAPQQLQTQNGVKEVLTNDLKAVLLQTSDEISKSSHPNQNELLKNIDKLSLQIDHYQLLSHLSNASSVYLPFSWDMLEEGNIEFQKSGDDKFTCDIDLKLKEFGEVNIKLTLFEKNQLKFHLYSEDEEFRTLVQENIPSLRSALIDTNITPREIRVLDKTKKEIPTSPYQTPEDRFEMGFEVKA